MPNLFGLDIAKIVNDSINQAGGLVPGTLTKVTAGTRTPGSLTGGTNPTTTSHSFQGILEEGERRMPDTLQTVKGKFVLILGASISPAAVPSTGDRVTIEGSEHDLVELIERDPAAATYTFRVED